MVSKRRYSPEENRQYIEKWCARRERAPVEVERKLKSRGVDSDESERMIEELKKKNFIDVDRFAGAFTRDKYRLNKWGIKKIEAALRRLHVPDRSIEAARDAIDMDEYLDNLRALRASKLKRVDDESGWRQSGKVLKYLYDRGYTAEDIARIGGEEAH